MKKFHQVLLRSIFILLSSNSCKLLLPAYSFPRNKAQRSMQTCSGGTLFQYNELHKCFHLNSAVSKVHLTFLMPQQPWQSCWRTNTFASSFPNSCMKQRRALQTVHLDTTQSAMEVEVLWLSVATWMNSTPTHSWSRLSKDYQTIIRGLKYARSQQCLWQCIHILPGGVGQVS